ncbi:MAG: glycosyltransferase [Suilimivivens sp.]
MMVQFFNCARNRKFQQKIPSYWEENLPDVDVYVTACHEPSSLIENTLKACFRLQYPDLRRIHIWLLDDGDNPELEKLAKSLQVGYITRKDHSGAKAGNLNHAMLITGAPLIAIFDADMAPHSDFLMKTVPYFLKAEESLMSRRIFTGIWNPPEMQSIQ